MSESSPEQFRIAELAQRTGLTPRTIRYYVAESLLPPPVGSGPHRLYGPDHLLRLEAIKRLKEQYFPLTEIRRRLASATRQDLEAILTGTPGEAAESALDYLAAIQPGSQPPIILPPGRTQPFHSGFVASLGNAGAPSYLSPGHPSRGEGQTSPYREPYPDAPARPHPNPFPLESGQSNDLGETVWNRVVLAPGVELNYQLTGDRARDTAVLRLIRNARQILGTVS